MRLNIYMKSGNIITVDGVKSFKYEIEGNKVTMLEVNQKLSLFNRASFNVKSIDLSSIEGMISIDTMLAYIKMKLGV